MTCIVGIVEHGVVYIGGDSAAANSYQIAIRYDTKVFQNNQDPQFLIGCTTSFRLAKLLQYALIPPEYDPADDLGRYMAIDFIDAVRQCLKEGGFAQKENEREVGGKFLVGFRGRLFCVESDYHIGESADGYDAVGGSSEIAMGVLFATKGLELPPQQRIALALQAAEHHNMDVRAPFVIKAVESGADPR